MIELIITILLSLGVNINSTNHFTISNDEANSIRSESNFEALGGEREFSQHVTISTDDPNEIVITDDDNPRN